MGDRERRTHVSWHEEDERSPLPPGAVWLWFPDYDSLLWPSLPVSNDPWGWGLGMRRMDTVTTAVRPIYLRLWKEWTYNKRWYKKIRLGDEMKWYNWTGYIHTHIRSVNCSCTHNPYCCKIMITWLLWDCCSNSLATVAHKDYSLVVVISHSLWQIMSQITATSKWEKDRQTNYPRTPLDREYSATRGVAS